MDDISPDEISCEIEELPDGGAILHLEMSPRCLEIFKTGAALAEKTVEEFIINLLETEAKRSIENLKSPSELIREKEKERYHVD